MAFICVVLKARKNSIMSGNVILDIFSGLKDDVESKEAAGCELIYAPSKVCALIFRGICL